MDETLKPDTYPPKSSNVSVRPIVVRGSLLCSGDVVWISDGWANPDTPCCEVDVEEVELVCRPIQREGVNVAERTRFSSAVDNGHEKSR